MPTRLLFFGNERLATGVTTTAPALRALIAAGYDIAAVVVAQKELNQSRKQRGLEIAEVAAEHSVEVIAPTNLRESIGQLAAYKAEAAVLVAYGKIVPQAVIDLFPKGIINIHPSLLPKHRGPTPLESVILHGERETGVSLMQLTAAMDAGPVFAQSRLQLDGSESKQLLADHLSLIGATMLTTHLPAILAGDIKATAQRDSMATYDKLIEKDSGKLSSLDFNESTEEIIRKIRAYALWPRVKTTIGTTEVIIVSAHTKHGSGTPGTLFLEGTELGYYTADGIVLIDSLIPSGKKEMSAQAFLAGYKP